MNDFFDKFIIAHRYLWSSEIAPESESEVMKIERVTILSLILR